MREWIRHIFSGRQPEPGPEFDLFFSGLIEDMDPVKTITRDRFRVRVFRGKDDTRDECGRITHWMFFDFRQDHQWLPMLALAEPNLHHVFSALNELFEFLDWEHDGSGDNVGPRRLPVVTVFGRRWFVDERLRQLRAVDAPHEFMELA